MTSGYLLLSHHSCLSIQAETPDAAQRGNPVDSSPHRHPFSFSPTLLPVCFTFPICIPFAPITHLKLGSCLVYSLVDHVLPRRQTPEPKLSSPDTDKSVTHFQDPKPFVVRIWTTLLTQSCRRVSFGRPRPLSCPHPFHRCSHGSAA